MAVVRHPVGVRLPRITRVLNLIVRSTRRAGVELDDRASPFSDVHLICVDARHRAPRLAEPRLRTSAPVCD